MAEADGVGAFLHNLGNLDSGLFYYQMDNIRSSHMVKIGRLDPAEVIRTLKPTLKRYDGKGVPFQGLNVGNAKNLSYDVLEKITNKFCSENFIQEVRHGRLFRGFIDAGQEGQREVTVKTWDFVFPGVHSYDTYPRKFRDEIILLERSEIKSHPFLVELFGFCFEKKLAVVYDLKFNTPLCELLTSAEFGWKERMKVATDYALLLKTLSREQFDLSCNGSEDIIIIDKEYNIKLVDFSLYAFPQTLGIRYSATTSVFGKAVKVHAYINQRALLLNMMRRYTKQRNLVKPAKTRFATAFLTLYSFYKQKKNLRTLFMSTEWNKSIYSKETLGKEVARHIISPFFWNDVVQALRVGDPLIHVLRMVDGEKKPPMGYIYEAMDRAKESIEKAFNYDTRKYKSVFEIIDARWTNQLHQPLHAAGHILNPGLYYKNNDMKTLTEDVWQGYHKCVERMIPDKNLQDKIGEELGVYMKADGLLGIESAIRARTLRSPDNTFIPKAYAFELGVLLLELITKKERAWKSERHPGYYISKMNQSSIVAESFEIDADTGTTITQLIQSCVNHVDERPDIDRVFDKLVSITGYRPAVSDSYPWIDSL